MNNLLCLLLMMAIIAAGCTRPANEALYLKAKVVETSDVSCGLPLLNFSEDALGIRNWKYFDDLAYTVTGLPDSLNIHDKKLFILVTILKPSEEFPCNTLGISYHHLKILSAKER